MKTENIPLAWFVCPVKKETLHKKGKRLYSSFGVYKRNETHGFYDFIPYELAELKNIQWKIWQVLQDNGEVSYGADPYNNLAYGEREDALAFMDFCRYRGHILDVGCGPQKDPTYMAYYEKKDVSFIGIDPLIGIQPKNFNFALGLGEYLPFRDRLFDQVLFATSLDHLVDPKLSLREAIRVIKDDGEICIWIGEKSKDAPKPKQSHAWYEKLQIPEGAEDPFHFKRLSGDDLDSFFRECKLKIKDKEVLAKGVYRKNLFYKLQS
jgi:SAM-dependent methyltransferase